MNWKSLTDFSGLGLQDIKAGIRFSSAVNLRLLLAVAALVYGTLALLSPGLSWRDSTNIVKDAAPSLHLWACIMLLDAVCLFWRLLDKTVRLWMGRIINISTFGLWFSMVSVSRVSLGYFSPDSTGEIILCIMAAWSTFRVDYTARDRGTA